MLHTERQFGIILITLVRTDCRTDIVIVFRTNDLAVTTIEHSAPAHVMSTHKLPGIVAGSNTATTTTVTMSPAKLGQ